MAFVLFLLIPVSVFTSSNCLDLINSLNTMHHLQYCLSNFPGCRSLLFALQNKSPKHPSPYYIVYHTFAEPPCAEAVYLWVSSAWVKQQGEILPSGSACRLPGVMCWGSVRNQMLNWTHLCSDRAVQPQTIQESVKCVLLSLPPPKKPSQSKESPQVLWEMYHPSISSFSCSRHVGLSADGQTS